MSRTLLATATVSLAVLAAYFVVPQPMRTPTPREVPRIGPWLRDHPGDWLAASAVIDHGLDSSSPSRLPLWHAAREHALLMAPYRLATHMAVLHSGLAHWYELADGDRQIVLGEAAPLLRDPQMFEEAHRAFWEATGDFALLRQANPGTQRALESLKQIAVTNGLYDDYRYCREALLRRRLEDFMVARKTREPADIASELPAQPDLDDQPLIVAALDEWHRRPLDANPSHDLDGVIDYAIRHGLGSLDGIEYLVLHSGASDPTRARLALQLGRPDRASAVELASNESNPAAWRQYEIERAYFELKRGDRAAAEGHLIKAARAGLVAEVLAAAVAIEGSPSARAELLSRYSTLNSWQGLCGTDVCKAARTQWFTGGASRTDLTLAVVQSDEDAPYVEIYADEARVAEGTVGGRTTFAITVPSGGVHRIEVRVANPMTRNLIQRRVRIVSS